MSTIFLGYFCYRLSKGKYLLKVVVMNFFSREDLTKFHYRVDNASNIFRGKSCSMMRKGRDYERDRC